MRTLPLLLCLAVSPAFAVDAPEVNETILVNKSRIFTDPDSVRDASIGSPFPCGKGKCVCLEFNGRNSFGGMSGLQMLLFQVSDTGNVVPLGAVQNAGPCGKMVAFPALSGR
jgi:hypothetical protein